MRDISISRAWTQGVALLFADKRLTATYLAMTVVIPFLLFSIHDGSNFRTFYALLADAGVFAASASTPWTILSLFLFSVIGLGSVAFAAWNAMLVPSRDGVIGEVMYGLVAGLISTVIAGAIYLGINLPFAVINMALSRLVQAGSVSLAAIGIVGLVNLFALLWLAARLSMTGPAMAAAGSLNPFPAMARSWRMTAPAQWRVFAFLLLFQIGGFLLIVGFIAGASALVFGTSNFGWQDTVITIGWIAVELILMTLFLIVSAGLYQELAGETDVTVFE